jgi:hypothetical protein
MVDLEYQFTHPAGACFLCGGDVDRVRTPGDDTDGDAPNDDSDPPGTGSDDPSDDDSDDDANDPSMSDGPSGQSGNKRRPDYWMKYFHLGASILGIPVSLLCVFALTIRVLAPYSLHLPRPPESLVFASRREKCPGIPI